MKICKLIYKEVSRGHQGDSHGNLSKGQARLLDEKKTNENVS